MQINNMVVNNIWTPVLIITSDTEQTYGPVIEDGNRRYSVTPLKSWHDDKYHYWFIVNSTEYIVLPDDAQQQIAALQSANTMLGQQVTGLTLSGAQKDVQITQLGQQIVQMQLDVAALKGGAET